VDRGIIRQQVRHPREVVGVDGVEQPSALKNPPVQ
jgi:hypothetical protein